MTDSELTAILLDTLWELWQRSPITSEPDGPRIFVRLVDDQYSEWDDWRVMALVSPAGKVASTSDALPRGLWRRVQAAVNRGEHVGEYLGDGLRAQWCRSSGDGPPESRVSDWAGEL